MRIFVLLCVFIGGLGQGVVNPKLPEILPDHDRLAIDSGISASLMYLGIFFMSFLYGRWADRGITFRQLSLGLLAYAAVLGLLVLAKSKEAVFALRLLEGLSLSAVYVSADVVLCRASSDEERGQWLSYYGAALSLGLLVGPALLLLAEVWSAPQALKISLLGVAALALCFSAASTRFHLPAAPSAEGDAKIRNARAPLAGVLYGFLEAGLVAVLGATVALSYHTKPEYVFVAIIISAALASIFWGWLIDRIGGRRTLAAVFALLTLTLLALSLWQKWQPSEGLILAAAVAFGLAAGGIYPAGFAWLVEGVHPSRFGYASGLFTRAYGLGSLFGPLCFGLAVEKAGPLGLFMLPAGLGIVGLIFARSAAAEVG
jgi:MFS transporter, DHA1 family, multidrug resistance protein